MFGEKQLFHQQKLNLVYRKVRWLRLYNLQNNACCIDVRKSKLKHGLLNLPNPS